MSRNQLILYFVAFIVAAVVVISLIISSFFSKAPSEQIITLSPSSAGNLRGVGDYPNLPPQAIDSSKNLHPNGTVKEQTITPEAEKIIERDQIIGQLIKKLPFHSSTFVLRYDIDTNSFIVSFSQDKISQSSREFDLFLKDNGIESRNWLYNLTVKQLTY